MLQASSSSLAVDYEVATRSGGHGWTVKAEVRRASLMKALRSLGERLDESRGTH
jgi:hypothetical protein